MSTTTALSVVTSSIATLQGGISYALPLVIPTVIFVTILFAMLVWIKRMYWKRV